VSSNQTATITATYATISAKASLTVTGGLTLPQHCYTFSSGTAASLAVNLPNLPAPTSPSAGSTDYVLTNINTAGDTATLNLGGTAYPFIPAPSLGGISLGGSFGLGDIGYGYVPYAAGLYVTTFGIDLLATDASQLNRPTSAVVSLSGLGNLLPNGLPAAFPPISAWTFTSGNQIIVLSDSSEQVFAIDSITSCSGVPPPAATQP
jgi:hypothetical protein